MDYHHHDGLVGGDSTSSHLEPELLSWFDPKSIDYYDGRSLSQKLVAEESFSSSSYEPYEPSSPAVEKLVLLIENNNERITGDSNADD